jgi:hypothetical protein
MRDKARVVVIAVLLAGGAALVGARGGGRGGGGGHASRGGARTSVSHVGSGSFNRNVGGNVNRNVGGTVNRNVNANRNVNRDVNFDRDVNVGRNYGWGDGCCYHPVARATAAAATTAAVVGSEVNSIPSSCGAVSVNGVTYQQCGDTWYQPEFSGSAVNYLVVNPPR